MPLSKVEFTGAIEIGFLTWHRTVLNPFFADIIPTSGCSQANIIQVLSTLPALPEDQYRYEVEERLFKRLSVFDYL